MQQISNSGMPVTPVEKFFRWLPFLVVGGLLFYFWGSVAEFVANALKNTIKTVIYGGILAAIVLYVWSNPSFIWMTYKNICRKFTSFFIKMDPLSYMDSYADLLDKKLANANAIIVKLSARQKASGRKIEELKAQVQGSLNKGKAALKIGDNRTASLEGTRAAGASQSIKLYTPNYDRMTKSLENLNALSENWGMASIKLREEIARKREEFDTLKAEAAALNQAEAFINGNTEEGKIYQESLKALEEKVTGYIAYIDDFEKRSKDMMAGIKVENQMQQDEGLNMLESFINDGTPDFNIGSIETIPYEEVNSPNGIQKQTKFNLLKK